MKWSEVTASPGNKLLRQFAGLCLVIFGGLAAYRAWRGQIDALTIVMGVAGVVIGLLGLVWPAAVRWVYTGWMIVAFPIGWVVSHVILAAIFGLVFLPVAVIFKLMGRDELRLRRRPAASSFWTTKAAPASAREYFRQS